MGCSTIHFRIFGDSAEAIISKLEKSKEIFSVTTEGEILWKFNKKLGQPHREVSIRGKGGTFFVMLFFFACALTGAKSSSHIFLKVVELKP